MKSDDFDTRAGEVSNTVGVPDESLLDAADAFRHAAISLSVSDQHGRVIDANDAFFELYGYDRSDNLDVGMLARESDQDWTLSYLTRLVTGEIDEFRSVKRFVRKDHSEFDGYLTLRAVRRDGACIGMVASVEPVDVRPTLDDSRVRKLLEHAAGTLTLVDEVGNVIETTGRYRETLGYPAEFWESRTILDIVVADDLELMIEMRDEVVSEPERVMTNDFRVQSADRSIETLEVTALNMLHDPDLRGIVLSTRNVTAERQNVDAIAGLRDEAVAEADQRSRLVATVSHELRNPLHAMSGLTELLASDESLGTEQRDLARSLMRQLRHLTTVTDDLLDAARFEVGRFEIRPTSVMLRDLVSDVVRTSNSFADGRLEVTGSVSDDVPELVTVDPARLQQILGNLMGNAVKFTEVGSVTLTTTVGVSEERGGLVLSFEVADTGIGIPVEQIARVFQPFSTASTSGDRRGAGLGLAIVQRLVHALGGDVHLRSAQGAGTVFTVEIPLVGAVVEGVGDSAVAAATRRRRVLVIEDTPVNQELAQHQLARLDLDCVIAGTAEIGLDLLDAEFFDAVLMDHQLPGMNGRDATREIRRRGDVTPIVGVTASSAGADERACLDAGMNAFLAKPVGLEQLSEALNSIFVDVDHRAALSASSAEPPFAVDGAIEVSVLDALAAEFGDRTIVEGLVRTFLGELGSRQADIATGDDELVSRQAHTLKSSAKLLGAGRLADLCAAAESHPTLRSGITEEAEAVRLDLTAWLESGTDHPDHNTG